MKKGITFNIIVSASKLFAFYLLTWAGVLSIILKDSLSFVIATPIAGTAIGIKQYLDSKKNKTIEDAKE
jgi:hypothetical protein